MYVNVNSIWGPDPLAAGASKINDTSDPQTTILTNFIPCSDLGLAGTDGQKKYNSIERQREGNFSPERLKVGNISFLKNCPAERPREGLGNSWDEQIGMYHAVWFARKNIHSGITCSLCSIAIGCCQVTWAADSLLLEEISICGDTRQHVSYRLLSIKTADFFFLNAFMKIQTSTRI